jgi:hypothetical protein
VAFDDIDPRMSDPRQLELELGRMIRPKNPSKPMSHKDADDLLNQFGNGSFGLIRAVERYHGIE